MRSQIPRSLRVGTCQAVCAGCRGGDAAKGTDVIDEVIDMGHKTIGHNVVGGKNG